MRSPLSIPHESPERDLIIITREDNAIAHVAGKLYMEGVTSEQAEKFDGIDWWKWRRGTNLHTVRRDVRARVIQALKDLEEKAKWQQSQQL